MKGKVLTALLVWSSYSLLLAQGITLQGYVFEANNRGYISQAQVDILESPGKIFITSTLTNVDGFFEVDLPPDRNFLVRIRKDLFLEKELIVQHKDIVAGEKKFINVELERKPGYIFDVTLANPRTNDTITTTGIHGALIEVFNNTTEKEYLRLEDYEYPNFKVTFEQGNHYTILVRKEGYYAKRMEAYVNVAGCILCFDGIGSVQPGVSDVLTAGHKMGTLLANVDLKPIVIDEMTKLNNINYALGSAALNTAAKEELRKVVDLLKDNPGMRVELSSHTDSRGADDMNMRLSQKRASVAKKYLTSFSGVDDNDIIGKGYGETRLDNRCANGVECDERQHRRNRRTEIKILEFNQELKSEWKPLVELKRLEKMEQILVDLQNQEVVEIPEKNPKEKPVVVDKTTADNQKQMVNETKEIIKEESIKKAEEADEKAEIKMLPTATKEEEKKEIIEENLNKDINPTKVANSSYKTLKSIPDGYSGYKIQVHESSELLEADHSLFKIFGNLELDKTKNGYAYLLGDFKEAEDANLFLNTIIKPRYPEAKLVQFVAGKRNTNPQ